MQQRARNARKVWSAWRAISRRGRGGVVVYDVHGLRGMAVVGCRMRMASLCDGGDVMLFGERG